jgi:DNA-directed RNA polymerase specialized sigma24 family protein
MISKLQANIKGWLFRLRRKRALDRLGKGRQELKRDMSDSILGDEFEEFDADKFFGIKEENFESGLSLPQEEMMQQMIQMMGM